MLPRHDALFLEFEDLLKDTVKEESPTKKIIKDDDKETIIHKLDANSLTLKDLLHEMETRGLQPRGFFADDAKVLQTCFDKEHEQYLRKKKKEREETKELETKQALKQRRKIMMETEIRGEKEELEKNPCTRKWFGLIKNNKAPSFCQIEVNNITVRPFARLLWCHFSIIYLDVSHMNLSDISGSFLARALKNNKSIRKLDLSGNLIGTRTCKTLADSLLNNDIIQCIILESNPLSAKNNVSGIKALASMLCKNQSLRHLNLWRCNTGIEAGSIISDAIFFNKTLICLDTGYNGWDNKDLCKVHQVLAKNRINLTQERKIRTELLKCKKAHRYAIKRNIEEKIKVNQNNKWLEEMKHDRSKIRREIVEQQQKERIVTERQKKLADEKKRLEEKIRTESRKIKGKNKKKKKK